MGRKNRKEVFLICTTVIVCIILFFMAIKMGKIESSWNIGDVLSLFGTMFLGCITVIQASNANTTNERLAKLEKNRYKLEMRPFAVIKKWDVFKTNPQELFCSQDKLYINVCKSDSAELTCLSISLLNTTSSYIAITYKGAKYVENNLDLDWYNYCGAVDQAIRLCPMESKEIVFCGNEEELFSSISKSNIKFSFSLENRFGEKYQEDIECKFVIVRAHSREAPVVLLTVSNYYIGKVVNESGVETISWEDTQSE